MRKINLSVTNGTLHIMCSEGVESWTISCKLEDIINTDGGCNFDLPVVRGYDPVADIRNHPSEFEEQDDGQEGDTSYIKEPSGYIEGVQGATGSGGEGERSR